MGLESLLPAIAGAAVTVMKGLFGTDKPVEVKSAEAKTQSLDADQLAALKRLQSLDTARTGD